MLKERFDFQQGADRSSLMCIVNSLSSKFPSVKIMAENIDVVDRIPCSEDWIINMYSDKVLESECPQEFVNVDAKDITIWVEPFDGSKDYNLEMLKIITVMIGIAVKGKAVGGIIHQPFYTPEDARTIWGLRGIGIGGRIKLEAPSTTSTYLFTSCRLGGAGYRAIQLLEGATHGYVCAAKKLKKWSTCAPQGILEASDCTVTDINGSQITYANEDPSNINGIVASSKYAAHENMILKVPLGIRNYLYERS